MKSSNNDNEALFSGSKPMHVSERVDRLLQFLIEYKELWYENGKSLEDKIDLITSDENEKNRIRALYYQAREDFAVLRPIRSRFLELKKGKHTTPAYKITEEQINTLRQAGVGKSFGLSDENQAEYDRLISLGIDDEVVQFIFKKFSSYQRFKEVFCDALRNGKEQELLRRCPKALSFLVSDIDLSEPNGIRKTDRNYVEFLRDVLGIKYFIFDGTNLVEKIEEFIKFNEDKSKISLTKNEIDVIRAIYGLGVNKKSSDEISKDFGISNSRVRQLLNHGLGKLSSRKLQLSDIVYLKDRDEVVKFLSNYFRKKDIFVAQKEYQEQGFSDNSPKLVEIHDIGLSKEMYSIIFSRKLRQQIDELDRARSIISVKLKMIFDNQLDRFVDIKFQDFYIGRIPIEKFGLSNRTINCLYSRNIYTISDIINFSRSCQGIMQKKIKNMGDKSYDELKELMSRVGAKLEDEDKSEMTRAHNDGILNLMSKTEAVRFYLYLAQIRYKAKNSIIRNNSIEELEFRISSIKEIYGIRVSSKDLVEKIYCRINELDQKFDYDTSIDVLDVPHEIRRAFKLHGINKVLDIYRLRDRDTNYMRKKYGAYFDIIIAELNRMGLDYPAKDKDPDNTIKCAIYLNKFNVELIIFSIEEAHISDEEKKKLKQALFDKIIQIGKNDSQDIDKRLSEKVEELKNAYRRLDSKREEFSQLESSQNNKSTPDSDDIGDIG